MIVCDRLQALHNRAPTLVRMLPSLARKVRKAYTVARRTAQDGDLSASCGGRIGTQRFETCPGSGSTCLVCASFGRPNLENADAARRCRFRNSQQKRASDLDPTYVWIPKLDVAGSSPVSRSIFSTTYK